MEWVRGEVIGRGSFGTVNLATLTKSNTDHHHHQTSIVVKSSHISNSSSLENEKKILTKLGNCHTNIIQFLGDSITEEKGTQFYNLFLEYASKGSLADHLRKSGGQFGNSDVQRYTQGILNGLCHVHENGFVHSDVKLQNVLLFEDGDVKVADFGLAKTTVQENNGSGCELRGTPLYMSPEIVAGGAVSAAADVWAVGCAVVEMVSGAPAWECSPESDVSGLLYRIGVLGECPRIPGSLCDEGRDFLSKCFIKDPNARWSARMLLDHPFISGCDSDDIIEKPTVSPKCPFEFPDWESTDCSSFGSGSVELEESDICSCSPISSRFDGEMVGDQVPDWVDLVGWVTIR